jgi:hypothetical protein
MSGPSSNVWDVEALYEYNYDWSQAELDRLAVAIRTGPPILRADPVIQDRGTGVSVGASFTIRANDPSMALRFALAALERGAGEAGIAIGDFREAFVNDATKDPRA